jgi:hypothetical protein
VSVVIQGPWKSPKDIAQPEMKALRDQVKVIEDEVGSVLLSLDALKIMLGVTLEEDWKDE